MKMLVMHKNKLSPQYFNPYYASNHLLFQFILSEFILAFSEMQLINNVIKKTELEWPLKNKDPRFYPALLQYISKLAGSTQHYMRLLSWNDDGFLTKLKNYCALLYHHDNTHNRDHEILQMYQESSQAWLLSLRILDVIRAVSQQPPIANPHEKRMLIPSLKKLHCSFQRFSRLVVHAVMPFHHNENVIFFILRHKEEFDSLYTPGFTKEWIQKMFPTGGIKEAGQFLLQRYTSRGFDNLIPTINTKIAELESS